MIRPSFCGGATVAALLAALALGACGDAAESEPVDGSAATVDRTLAGVIAEDDTLDGLEAVVETAGLTAVLDGQGPYTLFAPSQAALGGAAEDLSADQMSAQGAALVRAHIVPGALTRADIEAAIQRAGGEAVQMRTMTDDLLTFTRDGSDIVVSSADGARARLTAQETVASNGVVQPVDGILVAPAA